MHSHLFTAEEGVEFALEMTAKCTKLKMLELASGLKRIAYPLRHLSISKKHLVEFFNKSTSLQTLSLKNAQLSDMVNPP